MRLAEDDTPLDIDLSSPAPVWKPKAVLACMVDAFATLRRIPGAVGPKTPGSGWPAIVRELSDYHAGTFEEAPEMRPRLKPAQIKRMEEVIGWPMRFLSDEPLAANALNTWAMCKAYGVSIRDILAVRHKAAADIARRKENEQGLALGMIAPADCSPDKVISRTSMDRWRYVGARLIAEAL